MKNIVVLVSGGGTNLQALIDAQNSGKITGGKITCVVSSNPNAYALTRAANNNIPTEVIRRKDFESFDAYDEALTALLKAKNADLIVLAGFMTILGGKGVKVTGATAHFVNEICDGGPIIIQKAVEVKTGDTPEVLQKRVMEQAEWLILPRAVDLFCNDKIKVTGNITEILE